MFKVGKMMVVTAVLLVNTVVDLSACNVPVFRYALERWERDEYRLVVASRGELPASLKDDVAALKKKNFRAEGTTNIAVFTLDVTKPGENKELLAEYPEIAAVKKTTAFLLYPVGSYLPTIIWKSDVSDKLGTQLTQSPTMEEVTLEILKGSSAVWLFVDSGNKAKDDKAYARLKEAVTILNEEITLPDGVVETSGEITGGLTENELMDDFDPDNYLESGIPLKIHFEIKRLSVDKKEPVLRSILMNVEDDLHEYKDEPMAFSMFGRGRFLVPLVGEGINQENMSMAANYLAGACSCQVKNQNPGVDLLTKTDWISYLSGNEVVVDKELPPLTGTADLADVVEKTPEAEEAPAVSETSVESASPVSRNLLIMFGAAVVLIIAVSFAVTKRK